MPRIPLPNLPQPSRAGQLVFVTWGTLVVLVMIRELRNKPGVWPCPTTILKMSGLYAILGVTAEFAPQPSGWLAVGFGIAFVLKQAQEEIPTRGTWFGIPVSARPRLKPGPSVFESPISTAAVTQTTATQITATTRRPGRPF